MLGPAEGAEDIDLLFVPYKFAPQNLRAEVAHGPAGTLGAFGPNPVFFSDIYTPPCMKRSAQVDGEFEIRDIGIRNRFSNSNVPIDQTGKRDGLGE
jgi:hypothetical protein